MNIKKQDIIKYLKARNDGYGIEEANKYEQGLIAKQLNEGDCGC